MNKSLRFKLIRKKKEREHNAMRKKTLKGLRKERGLTQQGLANELGVNVRTIQTWENKEYNRTRISPVKRKFVSKYFEVKEEEIDF